MKEEMKVDMDTSIIYLQLWNESVWQYAADRALRNERRAEGGRFCDRY